MNPPSQIFTPSSLSRRRFLKGASVFAAATALPIERFAFGASGNDTLKIAAVGVGGRGSGAVSQALNTVNLGPVKLVAIADVHEDRLNAKRNKVKASHSDPKEDMPDRQFPGFAVFKRP